MFCGIRVIKIKNRGSSVIIPNNNKPKYLPLMIFDYIVMTF